MTMPLKASFHEVLPFCFPINMPRSTEIPPVDEQVIGATNTTREIVVFDALS